MNRKNFLFLLLIFWVLLAVYSVGYNIFNTYVEVRNWYFLTDTQKREKIFGDLYDFFMVVNHHTPQTSQIFVLSKDVRTHYFGMYSLYPRHIIDTDNEKIFMRLINTSQPNYIAIYNAPFFVPGYQQIASFSSKTTNVYGFLYKRK